MRLRITPRLADDSQARARLRRSRWWACVAIALLALAPGPDAHAEIYRWVDAHGRMHFTQDLGKVPALHRKAAEQAASRPAKRDIQVYDAPTRRTAARRAKAGRGAVPARGRVHRIRVEKAGISMRVKVRLNDRVTAPFLIDTGASDIALPRWVADELGLDLDGPNVRTRRYSTANGIIEQKAIVLDSVQLGSARAEQVRGAVTESMEVGLLGLSFFKHFNYNVDSVNGVVTLVENDLEERGLMRGGRSQAEWRVDYRSLRHRIARARVVLEEGSSNRTRKYQRLEEELAGLEHQFEVLEGEADLAHVPFSWRE